MDAVENKNYSRKGVVLLLFLGWLAYTAGNVGRMDYTASMVAIIDETGASKNAAGLVSSFFFFAYGAGQLVNGLLCHKYNSRLVIFGSLVLSAIANLCMPFCRSIEIMKWLWLLNGIVQSVMWSSIVKLQSEYLNEKDIGKSIIIMSTTTAAGTFIAYGLSALNVAFFSWQITFYIAAALLAASSAAWFCGIGYVQRKLPKFEVKKTTVSADGKRKIPAPIVISLVFVFVFATANGFVRDGINTWVPNLLKEVYDLETHFSIMLTLLLPLISIFGAYLAKLIYKKLPNDMLLSGMFFMLGGGVCALILWLYTYTLGFTVAMFAVVACCMSAVQNVITSAVPFRLRTVGNSGLFAGVINTFCYIGSTLASFLLGTLAEIGGWNTVILLLLILSVAVGVVSLCVAPFWHKKICPLIAE